MTEHLHHNSFTRELMLTQGLLINMRFAEPALLLAFGRISPESLSALWRPDFVDFVERFECRHIFWQPQPRQFAACEDVNVRFDLLRLIKSTGTNE
jgi:hypothetical protein